MTSASNVRGMIAIDKKGCKILFLNPATYETETVLDGFQPTVHELLVIPETGLAYVPIFGDGIHGRNPNPGHVLCVIDLLKRKHIGDIDLSPYVAPHTVRLGADGLIYITCENSAVVAVIDPKTHKMIAAIESGSTNGHRLAIAPRRPAPLHRQRGRRHGLGNRRSEPQALGKDQDAASARGHRGLRGRPYGGRGQR